MKMVYRIIYPEISSYLQNLCSYILFSWPSQGRVADPGVLFWSGSVKKNRTLFDHLDSKPVEKCDFYMLGLNFIKSDPDPGRFFDTRILAQFFLKVGSESILRFGSGWTVAGSAGLAQGAEITRKWTPGYK